MKKIVVLGAGESGVGAAVLAKKKGFDVFLSDRGKVSEKYKQVLLHHEIVFEDEKHSIEQILEADEVIKSPGIPDNVPLIQSIKAKGIPVISEIEFAARYTQAKLVCITGSNGKTTTTLLTYHLFKKAGFNVGLAGNVGKSFAMQVATENYDIYVLELSSFQLDGMVEFKADVAILTNITPDHLDRYEYKMENYVNSKFKITQNQTENDAFIYCADDEETLAGMKNHNLNMKKLPFSIKNEIEEGAYLKDETTINININNKPMSISIQNLALQGKHNIYNTMAAGIAARLFDIRKDSIRESMSDFQNAEHRMEHVANVYGIEFINDSKATNVNSAWWALESMRKPVIWIAGGVDKGNNYDALKAVVKEKVKAIICLGEDNAKIYDAFGSIVKNMENAKSATEAVALSYKYGQKGDVVLLSPACASFDLFENYEDRGMQFKHAVRSL